MAGTLKGKVALITGAGYGLGRATALAFAKEGVKVAVIDIAVERGQETVQMVKEAGGDAIFINADITKEAEVAAMIKKITDTYGKLDFAHNNAGVGETPTPIHEMTEEHWQKVMDVNTKGVWLCMKHELKYFVANGGGVIVNTASAAGLQGAPMNSTYATSKFAVVGLTRSAALEYAKANIRINCICPAGMRNTNLHDELMASNPAMAKELVKMIPMGRDSDPSEEAQAVVWLCSDASSFITGVALPIDGGVLAG